MYCSIISGLVLSRCMSFGVVQALFLQPITNITIHVRQVGCLIINVESEEVE